MKKFHRHVRHGRHGSGPDGTQMTCRYGPNGELSRIVADNRETRLNDDSRL